MQEAHSTMSSLLHLDPTIDQAIYALRPDFQALSIHASGMKNGPAAEPLQQAMRELLLKAGEASWKGSHLDAWRNAYRAFGAKRQRTPCSAEALIKRLERDGGLPSINAVVDAYNAISVRFAIPVGGENVSAYRGNPRLTRATGKETFATLRDGLPDEEAVEPGEVIWRDDIGVTCRRWNWRQSVRTRIEPSTMDMWFVLERLDPMPMEALQQAGTALHALLKHISPDAMITETLIGPS
jgi:DNA/RNA-binding domain of Phe-tRNA-synthetase-like protein